MISLTMITSAIVRDTLHAHFEKNSIISASKTGFMAKYSELYVLQVKTMDNSQDPLKKVGLLIELVHLDFMKTVDSVSLSIFTAYCYIILEKGGLKTFEKCNKLAQMARYLLVNLLPQI